MAGSPILGLISLVMVAGAVVMQFFIILSGAISGTPLNKVYFLQASSKGITGQGFQGISQVAWTYFSLCPITGGQTHNCRTVRPAFPFDPQMNFGLQNHGMNQIPSAFIDTKFYYYMSRFAWAFYLIALVFAVVALFTGLIALCSRIGSKISGVTTFVACFFQVLAAILMTAWTVKGRDAFNSVKSSGSSATLGKYAYGFSWGAFAALFIAAVLFCVGGRASKSESSYEDEGSKGGFFSRNRNSTRSQGVKDDYS